MFVLRKNTARDTCRAPSLSHPVRLNGGWRACRGTWRSWPTAGAGTASTRWRRSGPAPERLCRPAHGAGDPRVASPWFSRRSRGGRGMKHQSGPGAEDVEGSFAVRRRTLS